jgi:hypothetical protein
MPSHSPRSTRRFSTAAPLFRHRALTRLSWWIRPDKPPAIAARVGVVTEIAPERGDAPLPIAAYDWVVDATGSPGGLRSATAMTRPGRAPRTKLFPYEWFESPNIHFLTVHDFEALAALESLVVERRYFLAGHRKVDWQPNLTAEVGGVFGEAGIAPRKAATGSRLRFT